MEKQNKPQEIKVIGNIITNYNPKRIKVCCKYDEVYKVMRVDVKLKTKNSNGGKDE